MSNKITRRLIKSLAPTARREWNANVFVDSNELPGSQQISLFIGDSQQNNSRSNSNDLAGVAAVFSSSTTHLDSPNRYLNITVPLTQTLVDKNVGLRPEDVVPKLLKDLRWTVKQVSVRLILPPKGSSLAVKH